MTGDADRDGPGDVHPDEREDHPELDVDSAFAAIIAGWSDEAAHGVGPWPAAEDIDDDDLAHATPPPEEFPDPRADQAGRRTMLPIDPVGQVDAIAGRGQQADADVDADRYLPPEPPPLPRGDLVSRLAWAGVIGGPLFLLVAALVWRDLPAPLLLAALAAFVGGFVTLVARMPGEPGDDGDDGAVV